MINGDLLIGGKRVATPDHFRAQSPESGATIDPPFAIATAEHVATACALADAALDVFRETAPKVRAAFLETIANGIEAIADPLAARAAQETGLPPARLMGEVARTAAQLRLFATLLHEGRWAGVIIDNGLPDRAPLPRPDLRQRRIAVGPVAVFGASNFPLAFSVAGGDTASALAAGCPVVVKAHPAHPGTSMLAGEVIAAAAAQHDLPAGVFSLLQGPANALGAALVADPRIKAVGFTGSRGGGLALVAIANARAEPVPVYAEMASINPVILFPQALAGGAEALGKGYVASLTAGAGQFCTNPGLVLGVEGAALDRFVASAAGALDDVPAQLMLTEAIRQSYEAGVAARAEHAAVTHVGKGAAGKGHMLARANLFTTDADAFIANPALAQELFGAASIVVRCRSVTQIAAVIASLEGQLSITLHVAPQDAAIAAPLMPLLERKAGRLLANGWPTGVEVARAMVHGGPFPATSDPRTTSVGGAAIERFLRPVCYQNMPDALLPAALLPGNPLGLPRLIDGQQG